MPSKYESERTIGKVIRSICGDILEEFDESVLNKIFTNKQGKLDDIGTNYKNWTFNISAFIQNKKKKKLYLKFLHFVLRRRGIDPDKYEFWKLLMGIEMPSEFIETFDVIETQIPRLSVRSRTKKPPDKKEGEDDWFMV